MGRDIEFNFGANDVQEQAALNDVENDGAHLCMGRVKCMHCGKPYGFCNEVEYNLSTGGNMLPRAGDAPAQTGASGGGRKSKRSGFDYITEADLSTDKQTARILDVRANTEPVREGQQRFSDVTVKIAFKGQTRLHGLKLNNPNLKILQDDLGLDENKWPGREYHLFLEPDEFTGRYWVRVEVIPEEKPKARK